MTKAAYFEMCEALNSEPIAEEIPIEFEDLPTDVQVIFTIYNKLRDEWDTMNGVYLGKNMVGILDMLRVYEVLDEDRKLTLDVISMIDVHRSKLIKQALDAKKPQK